MCKIPSEMYGNKFTGSKDEDLDIFKGTIILPATRFPGNKEPPRIGLWELKEP